MSILGAVLPLGPMGGAPPPNSNSLGPSTTPGSWACLPLAAGCPRLHTLRWGSGQGKGGRGSRVQGMARPGMGVRPGGNNAVGTCFCGAAGWRWGQGQPRRQGGGKDRCRRQSRLSGGQGARDLGVSPGGGSEQRHRLSGLSLSPSPGDGDSDPECGCLSQGSLKSLSQ